MGRDQFLYVQVPLGVFFDNFIGSELPARCSRPFVKSVATRRGAKGRANARSIKSGVLYDALNTALGDSPYRFKVVPEAHNATAFAPAAALFKNPEAVTAKNYWAWMVSPVEVVTDESTAAFHFCPPESSGKEISSEELPFLVETAPGHEARRTLEECISEILLHQHRTHIFMLHISQSAARLSRWDRAGCIVSVPIDLTRELYKLQNAVFQLAYLSPLDQGFDDQVKLATSQQIKKLRKYNPRNMYLAQHRNNILANAEEYPIYEISCPAISTELADDLTKLRQRFPNMAGLGLDGEDSDEDSEAGLLRINIPFPRKMKKYLIGRPVTTRRPLAGRSTVGYVVYDLAEDRMSFLKDQWRWLDEMRSELDTIKYIRGRGVLGVARLEAGGDIVHHRTQSQHFMHGLPFSDKAVARIHIRLVTSNVGRPLGTSTSGSELLRYVACARYAHECAWKSAGVLHHDISDGNILIDVESDDAFLNDWDVAMFRDYIKRKHERDAFSGTWAYASALVLQYPKKPVEVEDDVEAFIWLIVYIAMRLYKHNLSKTPAKLADLTNKLFYEEEIDEYGYRVGGKTKMSYIDHGKPPIQLEDRKSPVAIFLDQAFKHLQEVYAKIDYKAIAHWKGSPRGTGRHAPRYSSKGVLDGLSHEALNKMLYTACNYRKEQLRGEASRLARNLPDMVQALASLAMNE
ncbi:uncharacterized protein PHACADRAFT_211242 [Phanerochaete carnosa HHB-10118-sp]|uniref:Fungal-type protein kinase domain-containing protein n=1 Tax=Phanerochaete carnosa (strain HHB-10118-sp) TaxID=650164 RepID=K5UU91_PHACS|nr:uncharacterized protein PHACADRAFT_211242 [Phanerochaete carnosa HHB-10118-sp]EKM53566.1 hypothetical protein PHACADRAFT_211242 [Phanerochaete carnosa HHB-10118-sp]